MIETLKGRVALVTGASRARGIGAAICRALAARGADICFTHWTPYDREFGVGEEADAPRELRAELKGYGVRAVGLAVDLSLPGAAVETFDRAMAEMGPISILVNNAAHSTTDGWESLDAAMLDAHYAVNLRTTALLSVAFARYWPGGEGGRIINLTSGQSRGPMPNELAYAATKGAIEAFTVSLAEGVARLGITANAVNPGPTDSGWMSDELKEDLIQRFPMGRIGQPEDAANAVAFLASSGAAWITGQVLHAEGGFRRDFTL